jgi:peptidoglycan/xylan/chitin deacetylase (PgdA/CDA1 family)
MAVRCVYKYDTYPHHESFLCRLVFCMPHPGSLLAGIRPPKPCQIKLVVLTFDDSVASHATFVAPLLKKHGFGATFFITEGFEFLVDKTHYMTWEQIKALHAQGFEIGNHTRKHAGVTKQKPEQLAADVEFIEQQCAKLASQSR